VNVDAAEANETLKPFLPLAERIGRLFASLSGSAPKTLEVCCDGDIAGYDTRIITLAVLKGFFGSTSDEPVTYVNAPQLAKDKGLEVREVHCATAEDFVNLITVRSDSHSISATVAGKRGDQRIVRIDEHGFDVPPADNLLIVKNDDRPGVIGTVGTLLGNAGINIADMDVGRTVETGTAVMLIAPTEPVPAEVLTALRAAPGIISATQITG
jgi:D-3-phosphoglycerate dehydrogenase